MKKWPGVICFFIFTSIYNYSNAQEVVHQQPRVLVLYENKGHHLSFTNRAVPWLKDHAKSENFHIEFITDTKKINKKFLQQFSLFLQLDFVPYGWTPDATSAFEEAINNGTIGWVGLHHASLLGEFDGYAMWQWFYSFMGNIKFVNYIPGFASAIVHLEKKNHPVFKGVSDSFKISKEEWYTYDKVPGQQVTVLANVDETSYSPPSTSLMGYHPVIWTNTSVKAKNIYIFMGHDPGLFDNADYLAIIKNAIRWAAHK